MRLSRSDYSARITRPHLSRVCVRVNGGGIPLFGILDSRRMVGRAASQRRGAGRERARARARREPEVYFRDPHQFRRLYSWCDENLRL